VIDLRPHPKGTILPVRARPGARRNELRGEQDGHLKVSVTQAPEKGKANQALIDLLSKKLSLRRSQLTLMSGDTKPKKLFLVSDVTIEDLAKRIESAWQQHG
jgi:uncharacterized protein YggU (UPF0235/DUF167 family)